MESLSVTWTPSDQTPLTVTVTVAVVPATAPENVPDPLAATWIGNPLAAAPEGLADWRVTVSPRSQSLATVPEIV